MQIVAFDYFEQYDPGFSNTEPYSFKFAWFGFETINFLQGLGTFLTFFIALLIIQGAIAFVIYKQISGMEYFFRH